MSGASDDRPAPDPAASDGIKRDQALPDGIKRDQALPDGIKRDQAFPDGTDPGSPDRQDPRPMRQPDGVDPESIRMETFIEAMTPQMPRYLQILERQALEAEVPVIRPQTQNLLRFLLTMKQPARILEIGTAVGFSALYMRHFAPDGCEIVTIEKDAGRILCAQDNFAKFTEKPDAIRLLAGDALEILPQMTGPGQDGCYDFIFMDAAKGQYIYFLPDVLRLLAPGGILVTDNILREGEILSSRFAVCRRNRTIHKRMRAYLEALMQEPALETLLLPAGDGAAVSLKKRPE